MNDYMRLRGKCHEMAADACRQDPTLTLVRGFYHCPTWGKQQHWWAARPDGSIVDPTADQFPSKGAGRYEPFDGFVQCDQCLRRVREDSVWRVEGRFAFCREHCYGVFVGVIDER